jgi:hypothetical protein
VFIDPIADIAVFGTPDTQERFEEAEAYEALTGDVAFRIGKLSPRTVGAGNSPGGRRREPIVSQARMLSLDGEWFACKVMSNGGPLWFDQPNSQ